MFFTGKKVATTKKTAAVSVVDINKKAREERQKERERLNAIVCVQSLARQFISNRRVASTLRAHCILDNPHYILSTAPNPVEWLLRAVREFLFISENSNSFNIKLASTLLPYIDSAYFNIAFEHNLTLQWTEQMKRLMKLFMPQLKTFPDLATWVQLVASPAALLQHITKPTSNIERNEDQMDVQDQRELENWQKILQSVYSSLAPLLPYLFDDLNTMVHLKYENTDHLITILDICVSWFLNLFKNNFGSTSSIIPLKSSNNISNHTSKEYLLAGLLSRRLISFLSQKFSDEISRKLFTSSPTSNNLLQALFRALKVLDKTDIQMDKSDAQMERHPLVPVDSLNFVQVAQFLSNKMNLYDVCMPLSVESMAAEISQQLETYHEFSKRYREELEAEEDFLDATDVENIDARIAANVRQFKALDTSLELISTATERVFSKEKVSLMVEKTCFGKSEKLQLEGFENIAKLISRLKTVTTISTSALLSLASPLVKLWRTLYEETLNKTEWNQIDHMSPLLALYCESYAFSLSTNINNEDFFTKQTPLTLEENREMLLYFKQLSVKRVSQAFQHPLPSHFISFLSAFNNLLRQFRKRNNYQTWSKMDDFLVPSLRAESLSGPAHSNYHFALYCPLLIPMVEKVKLFNHWIVKDRNEHQDQEWQPQSIQVGIRRGTHLLADAYHKLNPLHSQLKKRIQVQFLSEEGEPEPGIDGGGLFRELFTEVIARAFSPDYGLFKSTAENNLYPNPYASLLVDDSTRNFLFLGQLLGKCIYESLLVDLPFAPFFLSRLLGLSNTVRDLDSFDHTVFQSMQMLMDMKNVEELGLTFVLGETNAYGKATDIELCPGGSSIHVTSSNVAEYVQLLADRKLNTSIQTQSHAFKRGLSEVIDLKWLRLFTEEELTLVIGGEGGRLDIEDLKRNVVYNAGFHAHHPTIQYLWEVLDEFTNEEQTAFFKFLTSVGRPPILGFGDLQPLICIRNSKTDTTFLPSANTCLNLLKLPPYPTKKLLKEKLLYAIKSGARFELS